MLDSPTHYFLEPDLRCRTFFGASYCWLVAFKREVLVSDHVIPGILDVDGQCAWIALRPYAKCEPSYDSIYEERPASFESTADNGAGRNRAPVNASTDKELR
jgi:hypothetical protein